MEGTTIYRPFLSGDLLVCVDDNEGTVHSTLEDLQLYEQQRRLISYENLIGCMIEILFNKTEWRLAWFCHLILIIVHTIQFILRNAAVPPPNSGPTVTEISSSPTTATGGSNDNRNRNRNRNSDDNSNSNHDSNSTNNLHQAGRSLPSTYFTSLPLLHFTSLHFTSLHFLHFTSIYFTYFTNHSVIYISYNQLIIRNYCLLFLSYDVRH